MRNTALVAVAVAVLAVGFVLVQGSDDGTSTSAERTTPTTPAAPNATTTPEATTPAPAAEPAEPEVPTLVFANGEARGGVKRLSFTKGDQVRFRVRSDVAEEIHVHGFDKMEEVPAGGTAAFAFTATFDGAYEVEMEGSGTQIATLEIQP